MEPGGYNSSFLATYINTDKYYVLENTHFNDEYQRINFNRKTGDKHPEIQIFELEKKLIYELYLLISREFQILESEKTSSYFW